MWSRLTINLTPRNSSSNIGTAPDLDDQFFGRGHSCLPHKSHRYLLGLDTIPRYSYRLQKLGSRRDVVGEE